MKEVTQDTFGIHFGNCYAASIASIFELDLQLLPRVPKDPAVIEARYPKKDEYWKLEDQYSAWWWDMWAKWFAANNIKRVCFDADTFNKYHRHKIKGVYHLMSGPSPRDKEQKEHDGRGMTHTVVGRGGLVWWDPHPDRTGLLYVDEIELLIPLDPPRPILADYTRMALEKMAS